MSDPMWKQIESLDSHSTGKQALDIYDDYRGRYACNVPSGPATFKPAAKTKAPIKNLKEGK